MTNKKLRFKRLKETAVPSKFFGSNIPAYLSKPEVKERSQATTFSSRFEKEREKVEKDSEAFLSTLSFSSFEEMKSKESDCLIPNVITKYSGANAYFIGIEN